MFTSNNENAVPTVHWLPGVPCASAVSLFIFGINTRELPRGTCSGDVTSIPQDLPHRNTQVII